jgi:hypothetical protein
MKKCLLGNYVKICSHRANAERRCLAILDMGITCVDLQDREHFFRACELKGQG